MKVDSSGIDRQALCRLLEAECGLEVAGLSFMPEGEESCGFQREGVVRESVLKQGIFTDEYVYGLLKREWDGYRMERKCKGG